MSKRTASMQLTADNAEEEDARVDQAGIFQLASEDEIKSRVIKTARRGHTLETGSSSSLTGSGGIFANLKGLIGSTPNISGSTGITKGIFSSSTYSAPQGLFHHGSSVTSSESPATLPGTAAAFQASKSSHTLPSLTSHTLPSLTSHTLPSLAVGSFIKSAAPSSEYMEKLQALNTGVSGWISKHVQENPYVDLSPIFKDYASHLADIDAKYRVNEEIGGSKELPSDASQESHDSPPMQSSCTSEVEGVAGSGASSTPISDDVKVSSGSVSSSQQSSNQQLSPNVQNGRDSQSSNNLNTPVETTPSTNPAEPSEDVDALFSVRAKLFYKKESEFVDLGVGTLKVQSSSPKTVRLLLRNDSSLRNVILNIKVTADVPLSWNKKSVLLMCPSPNPPLSVGEGPVTYLIRVRSVELAEELLAVLKAQTGRQGE